MEKCQLRFSGEKRRFCAGFEPEREGDTVSTSSTSLRLSRRDELDIHGHYGRSRRMGKTVLRYGLLYGAPLALVALLLQWAQYRYFLLEMPGETYIALVAVVFIALGIWVGTRLTATRRTHCSMSRFIAAASHDHSCVRAWWC